MQLCSSVSLSLQSQKGGCLNKAGLIEASPPPSLCPATPTWEDKYFSSKRGWDLKLQQRPSKCYSGASERLWRAPRCPQLKECTALGLHCVLEVVNVTFFSWCFTWYDSLSCEYLKILEPIVHVSVFWVPFICCICLCYIKLPFFLIYENTEQKLKEWNSLFLLIHFHCWIR